MPLRRWLTPAVLMLAMPAAAAWMPWDFHKNATRERESAAVETKCELGATRFNDDGSPQICLKR